MTHPQSNLIDLSHEIHDGLVTYKGLPAPHICDFWTREESAANYAGGESFQIGRIDMVANTGTYIDAPFHRYADGADLSELRLSQLANLPGICFSADQHETSPDIFHGHDLKGKAVLLHTGWSRHWNTEAYFEGHPYLTAEAAEYLREQGAALVGIDSYNIDNSASNSRPVHSILLGAGIVIAEHLCNLHQLPEQGFTFTAVPPKIKGMGSFPVRAFAKLNPS